MGPFSPLYAPAAAVDTAPAPGLAVSSVESVQLLVNCRPQIAVAPLPFDLTDDAGGVSSDAVRGVWLETVTLLQVASGQQQRHRH